MSVCVRVQDIYRIGFQWMASLTVTKPKHLIMGSLTQALLHCSTYRHEEKCLRQSLLFSSAEHGQLHTGPVNGDHLFAEV